jgi:hypothetical protein
MRRKLHWTDWNPGLDNDHLTLGEVLGSLPAAPPDAIPWQVRLLENPSSPIAFPGAISLERHDALHALLGRGLSNQDEAFVIGFTMGAARKIRGWHFSLFRFLATRIYPKAYRFKQSDLISFDLGFAQGQQGTARDVHLAPFETRGGNTLREIRRELGIDIQSLHAAYRMEAIHLPHTSASRRLDKDYGGVDPSDVHSPQGRDSDWQREQSK